MREMRLEETVGAVGRTRWVPRRLSEMAAAMAADRMPRMGPDCEPYEYRGKVRAALLDRGWLR
jgi:hypothetical protein